MARRATPAWTVIAIFFTFAISLPLNHVCIYDDSASPAPGSMAAPSTDVAAPTQVSQARPPMQKDDTCAACLWSNTLLLRQERVELRMAPAATPMAPTARKLPLVSADLYQSPSKRGPPRRTIL
jgi:hypothetical protein